MPAVIVPDLRRKFALLRSHSTRKSWGDLAAPFGVPHKTLQYWQQGSIRRDPDRMPDWALPILIRLIAEILPGERSPDEVRVFASGPAAPLEEELRTGAAVSLLELLDKEARQDTASLIRGSDGIDLVEVETADRAPCPRLALGERFRIVFRRRHPSGYLLALQHAQRVWALVPSTVSQSTPITILVPGVDGRGAPSFMRERRDPGRHRFICLEMPEPPPASLLALGRDDVTLDKRALDGLTAFYLKQPKAKRACYLLVVEFEAAERP